jgi:DNA-binding transcriptional regulator YiaG
MALVGFQMKPYTDKKGKPKNFCDRCSEPIYENVSADRRITCWKCTDIKVQNIKRLEEETKIEVNKSSDLGSISAKKKLDTLLEPGKRLLNTRKEMGFSRAKLAIFLGVSINYLRKMENGLKPLNRKALGFSEQNEKR